MHFTSKPRGTTRIFRPLWLAVTLAGAAFTYTAAQGGGGAQSPTTSANAADLKWQPASPALPAGTQMVVLQGDPGKAGDVVTIRLRFPAGAVVPPHTHSTDEAATVLSGRFHVAPGDVLDKTKGVAVTAGGFTLQKAGIHHYAWVDGVTVVQFSGLGPMDITYINPADDPSLRK